MLDYQRVCDSVSTWDLILVRRGQHNCYFLDAMTWRILEWGDVLSFSDVAGICIADNMGFTLMALNTYKWDELTPITKVIYHEIIPFMIVKGHNCALVG